MYLILFRFQLCDANYDLFIQVKLNEVIVIILEEVMPFYDIYYFLDF